MARKTSAKSSTTTRKPTKPTLLAGGNPQIGKGEGDAPVQAYLAAMPGWKRDVGRRLDAIVTRTVPKVRKAVKWKYVKVAFFNGVSLRPLPPGPSAHKDVRYLDIREDDEFDEKQLSNRIRQASKLPGWTP